MIDTALVDTLIYHYQDASVPPPDHRSFTINLNETSAELIVDSYGSVIAKRQVTVNTHLIKELISLVATKRIRLCQYKEALDCSGSTGESLKLYEGDRVVFQGEVQHCIDGDAGTLCGELEVLTKKLRSLFADLNQL